MFWGSGGLKWEPHEMWDVEGLWWGNTVPNKGILYSEAASDLWETESRWRDPAHCCPQHKAAYAGHSGQSGVPGAGGPGAQMGAAWRWASDAVYSAGVESVDRSRCRGGVWWGRSNFYRGVRLESLTSDLGFASLSQWSRHGSLSSCWLGWSHAGCLAPPGWVRLWSLCRQPGGPPRGSTCPSSW